jgi:hypothetical protein
VTRKVNGGCFEVIQRFQNLVQLFEVYYWGFLTEEDDSGEASGAHGREVHARFL